MDSKHAQVTEFHTNWANEFICEMEGGAASLTSTDFRNAKKLAQLLADALAAEAERVRREVGDELLNCVTIEHCCDLLAKERDWWHRNWHRDTGIPCDGTMEVCKRALADQPRQGVKG